MRQRDQGRVDALRFLKFAVQAVEKGTPGNAGMTPAMIEVVSKQSQRPPRERQSLPRRRAHRAGGQGSRRAGRPGGVPASPIERRRNRSPDTGDRGSGGRNRPPRPGQGHGPPDAAGARQGRRRGGQPPGGGRFWTRWGRHRVCDNSTTTHPSFPRKRESIEVKSEAVNPSKVV